MSSKQYIRQDEAVLNDANLAIRWRTGDTGNRLDCETAALLRAHLRPVFEAAASWRELITELSGAGFGLTFRDGRLMVTDFESGARICTGRFLGMPLSDLAARLGRPCVLAAHGNDGAGEFLH